MVSLTNLPKSSFASFIPSGFPFYSKTNKKLYNHALLMAFNGLKVARRDCLTSKIRLRFSGFILFSGKVFSMLTGMLFVIIVVRNLSPSEFGVWQNIADVLGYFILMNTIIPSWAGRYVARGMESAGKTSILINFAISIPLMLLCFLMAPVFAKIAGTNSIYYALASFQIVELYLKPAFEALANAKKPYLLGYDLAIHEITKLFFGFIFVAFLRIGLLGAIVTIILADLIDIAFYSIAFIDELKSNIKLNYISGWLKGSIISLYSMVGTSLSSFATIMLLILGGTLARAYLGAVSTIATLVTYASSLGVALYPKLLVGGKSEDVEASIKLTLMFATPMTFGILALAEHLLTILNPIYSIAKTILYIAALNSLIVCFTNIVDTIILGTEKVDAQAKFSMKDLRKSKLFLLPTFSYVYATIDLPILYYFLAYIAKSPFEKAFYFVLINFPISLMILIMKYKIAKKCLSFKFPLKTIAKYVLASTIMAFVVKPFGLSLPSRISFIFALILLGIVVYFAILFMIDEETKALVRLTLKELNAQIKKLTSFLGFMHQKFI